MTFMQALHRITQDADAMLGRPKDVSFAIDQAISWNESSPELKGRIDTKKIGMMGHSYGAYTTLVVCGARPIHDYLIPAQNPPTGLAGDLSDPRVTFGFPMSPQPIGGTYFGEDSYNTINRPLVCLTGPKDDWKTFDGKVMPGERRLEVFKLLPPGEKYFFWLENADHMSFSDGPKAVGPFRTGAMPDAQRISKALMVVSCDYYLKGKKSAAEFISEAYVNSLCGKVVTKAKLMTK
jgi:predicted dienelactone hydrolase